MGNLKQNKTNRQTTKNPKLINIENKLVIARGERNAGDGQGLRSTNFQLSNRERKGTAEGI